MFLARRMVGPIQALRAGAERIGGGDFAQRISIKTGDELEGLANQFNDMGARLQESYADLENKVEQRTAELSESLQQQTATSEVLHVISSSPGELKPVFNAMLNNVTRLCEAKFASLYLFDESGSHMVASINLPEAYDNWRRSTSGQGRHMRQLLQSMKIIHTVDCAADPAYGERDPTRVAVVELAGARTMLTVPMLKEGALVGAFNIFRQEVRAFTDKQVDLVASFAAQAVIAIENARLLNELRKRTDDLSELLEQQTATSEVLQVISSSPGELEPVFQTMLANAMRLCEASHGVVWLREGDGFRSAAFRGTLSKAFVELWQPGTFVRPGSDAPIVLAAQSGKAVQVEDLRESPAYRNGDPLPVAAVEIAGIRTILSVPMFKDSECVGAIALSRKEVRVFSDKQIELVANFAKQAVIAIENARLLRELHQRTDDLTESLEQQTATSEVLEVISSSAGELEPVFNKMLENATRICGANFGTMNLYADGGFRTVAVYNAPQAYAATQLHEVIHPHPQSGLGTIERTHQTASISRTSGRSSALPRG